MNHRVAENSLRNLAFHHFGILVKEIVTAARYYEESLGFEVRSKIMRDPVQGAFIQFLAVPESQVYLELISPDEQNSSLVKSLKRGTGLHHVCFSTASLEDSLSSLRTDGALIVRQPVAAVAFGNFRIAWILDRTHTLVELVEEAGVAELEAACARP